ncbi:PDZ domain-containing protein [Mucilaginibacter terrenus]|uniref:PDZ domain-containing protein n=1 Tax=Mucilaginibacter terrenus TaxID=2482727 RepID=A0A3E2NW40_9SPHI|nr:trypsin-like peptidase domain-containing protein [Mucilaginibacter terrenus]RFZ85225.1 PDZ domain-containing protein [Mucilaginibacter terrenus]
MSTRLGQYCHRITLLCKIGIGILTYLILPDSILAQKKRSINAMHVTKLSEVIKKVSPACVRMFAFDTVVNRQAGPQFSGVVVTKDGYILTVAHTTIPGNIYSVNFPDGKMVIAQALGRIMFSATPQLPDVSMMKILGEGVYPFAEIGTSRELRLHQKCISISYPETLALNFPTVRLGQITVPATEQGMIQSSCKMEPGDSGGPLFNVAGQVIGLHSAIDIPEDINFDVPVDIYRRYWSSLKIPVTYDAFPMTKDSLIQKSFKPAMLIKDLVHLQTNVKKKATQFTATVKSIVNGTEKQLLGTVIRTDQKSKMSTSIFVISKSSEVGNKVRVIFNDGNSNDANIVARDKRNDLILLSVSPQSIYPSRDEIFNKEQFDTVYAGQHLFCLNSQRQPMKGIAGASVFALPKKFSLGYLGAFIDVRHRPFPVSNVLDGSPASLYGIKVGDTIKVIQGRVMERPEDFGAVLSDLWPGDTTAFEILRANQRIDLKVVLGNWPLNLTTHPADHFKGGKSIRRDGFQKVFAHDCVLEANDAGGPVFDYSGKFLGVNIARFSRTTTLALPASVIFQFLYDNTVIVGKGQRQI